MSRGLGPQAAAARRGSWIGVAAWGLILTGVARAVEDKENKPEAATPAPASRAAASAAEARLKEDVTFLAADAREGRGPGTQGIEAAAEYIAGVFKAAGLKAAPGAD
ncbi:MAG TPA: hypothetical protein VFF52_01970, partial [Isosphaeraceae bacterium]|nr:hypothetical protein [Isosphaeraceae bacterium]